MASVSEAQAQTQEALAGAVAGRNLPSDVRGRATKLLARLKTVTQVSILGQPGSGKSSVLNLLAGQDIIPDGVGLCTLKLVHGEEPRSLVTLRDGSNLTMDGTPEVTRIAKMNPVFVQLEMPLPALGKISLLEVVTSDERVEQLRAVKWAIKQTDIAIWCTQRYDASEQSLWSDVPDAIKDHAVLARTRADELSGSRSSVEQELSRIAGADFAHVMAISTLEAHLARSSSASIDRKKLKSSGATRLISTILRQIENGRQSAIDQAEILLHKYRKQIAEAPLDLVEAEEVQPEPVVEEAPAEPQETAVEAAPAAEVAEDVQSDDIADAPEEIEATQDTTEQAAAREVAPAEATQAEPEEVVEPVAEAAPEEEAAVEETVAEAAPVEEAAVEETVAEAALVEEAATEETVAEAAPVEEAATEETVAEAAPVEEATVEETVAESAEAEIEVSEPDPEVDLLAESSDEPDADAPHDLMANVFAALEASPVPYDKVTKPKARRVARKAAEAEAAADPAPQAAPEAAEPAPEPKAEVSAETTEEAPAKVAPEAEAPTADMLPAEIRKRARRKRRIKLAGAENGKAEPAKRRTKRAEPEENIPPISSDVLATEEFIFANQKTKIDPDQDAAVRVALSDACNRLQDAGADLLRIDENDAKALLERSATTLGWLGDHLGDDKWPQSPILERMREMTQDADDLVQLLKVEGDARGASDAVTTMLQLKRGMQAELSD